MTEYRWPVIAGTAVLVLVLFFGINFYRQRYMQEEPFLNALEEMESIEEAEIIEEQGEDALQLVICGSYRGSLKELIDGVNAQSEEYFKKPLTVLLVDSRNGDLDNYAIDVAPALFEGARLGNYRSAAESVYSMASAYNLEEVKFNVDEKQLYLQARDGDYYLYLIVPLDLTEGEA